MNRHACIRKAILGLMARHDIEDTGLLVLDRHHLRDQIEALIRFHRESDGKAAFKQWLLPDTSLVVVESKTIDFAAMSYEPGWLYGAGFRFQKPYFGSKPGELREKRDVGAVFERRGGGRCLFVMPDGPDLTAIDAKIR